MQKKKSMEKQERRRTKDFFDRIAPSTIRFYAGHYIVGDSYRCAWAIREYPPSTDEQAIFSRIADKSGVTLRIYHRLVEPMEQRKIIQNAMRKNKLKTSGTDMTETVEAEADFDINVNDKGLSNSVTITANEEVTLVLTRDGEVVEYKPGDAITQPAAYTLTITDVLGNKAEMSFTIVEPLVQKFEHNFDDTPGFEKALVNGEEKRLNYGTLELFGGGTYEVGIVVSGKTYTFTVTVDATAPTLKLEGVENGGKTTGGVVISEPPETAEIKVYRGEEEIEYKLGETISEEGEYRVTITDECGNSAVYTFTIEAGTNWALIILLVVFGLLVAGGLVFFFIRRKKVADQDEA